MAFTVEKISINQIKSNQINQIKNLIYNQGWLEICQYFFCPLLYIFFNRPTHFYKRESVGKQNRHLMGMALVFVKYNVQNCILYKLSFIFNFVSNAINSKCSRWFQNLRYYTNVYCEILSHLLHFFYAIKHFIVPKCTSTKNYETFHTLYSCNLLFLTITPPQKINK